jgi:hypothetical protein
MPSPEVEEIIGIFQGVDDLPEGQRADVLRTVVESVLGVLQGDTPGSLERLTSYAPEVTTQRSPATLDRNLTSRGLHALAAIWEGSRNPDDFPLDTNELMGQMSLWQQSVREYHAHLEGDIEPPDTNQRAYYTRVCLGYLIESLASRIPDGRLGLNRGPTLADLEARAAARVEHRFPLEQRPVGQPPYPSVWDHIGADDE